MHRSALRRRCAWQAELPDATVVTSYSLTSANDVPRATLRTGPSPAPPTARPGRRSTRGAIAPFESRFQAKQFSFANTTAYRFYRFVFVPKAGVSHFQVAEIGLAGVTSAGGSLVYVSSPSGDSDGTGDGADLARTRRRRRRAPRGRSPSPDPACSGSSTCPPSVVATSYVLTSAADAPEHDPRDWTLEGSVDGAGVGAARHAVRSVIRRRAARRRPSRSRNTTAYSLVPPDVRHRLAGHAVLDRGDRARRQRVRLAQSSARSSTTGEPSTRPSACTSRGSAAPPAACCARRSRAAPPTSWCCGTRRTPPPGSRARSRLTSAQADAPDRRRRRARTHRRSRASWATA